MPRQSEHTLRARRRAIAQSGPGAQIPGAVHPMPRRWRFGAASADRPSVRATGKIHRYLLTSFNIYFRMVLLLLMGRSHIHSHIVYAAISAGKPDTPFEAVLQRIWKKKTKHTDYQFIYSLASKEV